VLIIIGKHKNPHRTQRGPIFNELRFDYSGLPTLQRFSARDGAALSYRHYPAPSNNILILLHGSGWHSQYFLPLALPENFHIELLRQGGEQNEPFS